LALVRQSREEEREEGSQKTVTGWRVKLETKAGSQRAMGGGGGSYSMITFDPVVGEMRQANQKLDAINHSINANGRKPAIMAA
jgi:hypothetical protein